MTKQTTVCKIETCNREPVAITNGIHVCERCRRDFVSVGNGAVYFGTGWHGVRDASYTDEQRAAFPGLAAR